LQQVLAETRETLLLDEPLAAGDQQALAEVARRHRGRPLTLEPVARELVSAILRNHFSGLPGFLRGEQSLSAQVAQSLMEDPVARERLEAFWVRLGEPP
jgi:hypothetical protein